MKQPVDHQEKKEKVEHPEGWIWTVGRYGQLSETDFVDWVEEGIMNFLSVVLACSMIAHVGICLGDRVQWFRAEAEMQRWQEELEIKQAEFLRCIRSFGRMKEIWTALSNRATSIGLVAYAKQKAAMYSKMEIQCRNKLQVTGFGRILEVVKDGQILADHIASERQKQTN